MRKYFFLTLGTSQTLLDNFYKNITFNPSSNRQISTSNRQLWRSFFWNNKKEHSHTLFGTWNKSSVRLLSKVESSTALLEPRKLLFSSKKFRCKTNLLVTTQDYTDRRLKVRNTRKISIEKKEETSVASWNPCKSTKSRSELTVSPTKCSKKICNKGHQKL